MLAVFQRAQQTLWPSSLRFLMFYDEEVLKKVRVFYLIFIAPESNKIYSFDILQWKPTLLLT